MKIRNHLARLMAGALLATSAATAVALAPSAAHAATTYTDTATLGAPSGIVEYGGSVYLDGRVESSDGFSPEGTVYLQELAYGSRTWRTVASSDNTGYPYFTIQAAISGSLRIYYPGHTATSDGDDNYKAAVSAPVSLKVARKLTVKTKGLHVKGKVSPAHGKMKIVFKVKKGKHYKKWFKVKTKKNGKFKKTVPHEKIGTKVLVMIPGGQGYAANAWYGQYY